MVRIDPLKVGGLFYVVAVFQFFVFELVAEAVYPGYSVATNYISDLGATCVNPPSTAVCVVHQPSAAIFDSTVFVLGVLLLAGTCLVYLGTRKAPYLIVAAISDIATLLVGVFPENTGWVHAIISIIVFLFLGISLIVASTLTKHTAIRYLVVAFGVLTLFFNLTSAGTSLVGAGGVERLIVLPVLLGLMTLGGYLTGQDAPTQGA